MMNYVFRICEIEYNDHLIDNYDIAVDKIKQQSDLTAFMKFVNRMASNEIQAIFFTMMMKNSRTVKIARGNKEISDWAVDNFNIM